MAECKPLISMEQVSYSYEEEGDLALVDVSLTMKRGEFVAFVGQNGAGKTTCAKHLNGTLEPSSGRVFIAGRDTRKVAASDLAQTVGYCYQNPDHQIWALKVEDELAFGPRNLGLPEDDQRRRVDEVLDLVDLTDKRDEYTFSLGWGERQKLAVAAILAMRPEVIIVDEPTTGLDWRGAVRIMDLLARLNDQGLTVVIITHDMSVVAAYTRRAIVFARGRVVKDASTSEILRDLQALTEADLRPPQFVRLELALQSCGVNLNGNHPDELTQAIRSKFKSVASGI